MNKLVEISIIMPCYNSEKYLSEAIESVLRQTFTNWELIIVNDGSTDNTYTIAETYRSIDSRIKLVSKENGGYVSARLYGLRYISASAFLHFFDSDDILHEEMLSILYKRISSNPDLGAVYCNFFEMNKDGGIIGRPLFGIRMVPTLFGMKKISEEYPFTHFISIFCTATRMIEPMVLIRRTAYERSSGWNPAFGKGKGNNGDGVLLFSEIALEWKIGYINEPLYYYRRHEDQNTSNSYLNRNGMNKVIDIWKTRVKQGYKYSRDIKAAIKVFKYRFYVFTKIGSLKHSLRFRPFEFIILMTAIIIKYFISLQLILFYNTKIFDRNTYVD